MSDSVRTVSELTREIKRLLGESFGGVWIEGELSGFKIHSSGHAYFTLKDAHAQLSCAMWKQSVLRSNLAALKDGVKVHAFGNIEVYEPQGKYQLIVASLRTAGVGELQQRFEQLKAQLQSEGLFELARKRRLPAYPHVIGIVTSPTGAVIQDMKTVAARRWPLAQLVLVPVKVQGEGAAQEIAGGIKRLNHEPGVELILVGRGGGSLEDLWAFNEEVVARAIFASKLPVVSAVGHEVDFTIADLVADVRAPTPSAAMEMILPDREQVRELVSELNRRLAKAVADRQREGRERVIALAHHWAFRQPLNLVLFAAQRVDDLQGRLQNVCTATLEQKRQALEQTQQLLTAYHPQHILARGFSIVKDARGNVLRGTQQLKSGDSISIQLADGAATADVTSVS